MTRNAFTNSQRTVSTDKSNQQKLSLQAAQENIYSSLLGIVKQRHPTDAIQEFSSLFVHHNDSVSSDIAQAVHLLILNNDEDEFRYTIKRSCYILVNNWETTRENKYIQELIELFNNPIIEKQSLSSTTNRLRTWIRNFVESKDYQELLLFAAKYEEESHWSDRYTSHLLVAQYADVKNPAEQRDAARVKAKQLKYRFKFDLAMYIARSQSSSANKHCENPTRLGDEVLRLIKIIVAKRGPFGYSGIANIFVKQTQGQKYQQFKQSLHRYLIFCVKDRVFVDTLELNLAEKLALLYEKYHEETLNDALLLRTCNRVIDYLTTENGQDPSPLFVVLMSQGNALTLVVVLVKIILICKYARTHLETRIADLIRCYKNYPEEECQWMINFLEIFNIIFTICAENVQYNLIKMSEDCVDGQPEISLDSYRVFSQLKDEQKLEAIPEAYSLAETPPV